MLSFVMLRPDPFALAHESNVRTEADAAAARPMRQILMRPSVMAAIAALVAGQATMVLIMTMTPLHLTEHNHGLRPSGLVISGHVAGMYALAPVSGWISQRFGSLRTIFLGTGVLVARLAPRGRSRRPSSDELLFVALFLLGFGWNLGLRRRQRAALGGRRPRRSGARPGRRRRGDLDDVGGREPRLRRRRRRGRLLDARVPRRRARARAGVAAAQPPPRDRGGAPRRSRARVRRPARARATPRGSARRRRPRRPRPTRRPSARRACRRARRSPSACRPR